MKDLFNLIVRAFERLGEEISISTIVEYQVEECVKETTYIYSSRGELSNDTPFTYSSLNSKAIGNTTYINNLRMFSWYCGEIREELDKDIERGVKIINKYDCYNGEYLDIVVVQNLHDFVVYLKENLHVEDYGFEIGKLLKD